MAVSVDQASLEYYLILSALAGHDFKNRTGHLENKPVRHINFFKKFAELQVLMLQHNAGLTSSHPYASEPFSWPFLLSGISFWTDNETKQQIYLMGNVVGWWLCVGGMSIWCGIMLADALSRRRGIHPIEDRELLLHCASLLC
jgi:dolichyl-phosphate-mannose-protein mannosyltransferase